MKRRSSLPFTVTYSTMLLQIAPSKVVTSSGSFSSDEELSLYDMLFSENLSKQDIQKIKQVAIDLLQKVKAKIAELDHWTDKQETKATIDNLIRDTKAMPMLTHC